MHLITPTIRPIAPFAHLAGRTVTTRPSRALRRRMRTPEPLTISQWADKYRRVTEIDAKPGAWRSELVPHAVPIMDDIARPWVRQVWICLPERGAKTQILLNTVCWGIDQGSAAGNIFWLMPTEHDARKAMGERVIPVFRAKDDHGRPGRIARYLSHAADDTSRGAIRFNHGIRLFPAWANSPGSMAAYFGRINIADECDKFPERTSEGSDPITLFLKRARDDRHRSKYVFASTPAGRFIYRGAMACAQIKTWAMRCPDCSELVTPGEEHLVIPEGTTVENINRADLGLACPACGTDWNEERRAVAYHGGREKILAGADNHRPESIGWHVPAWVFPVIPLTEIVAARLRAKTGDHASRVAWANGYRVEDHIQEVKERHEEIILRLRDDRPVAIVPTWADALEISVDTQDAGFWYRVRAWQYQTMQSALVRHGYVESFDGLDTIIYHSTHRDSEGGEHRIMAGIIDSAGHRTAEVYDWCRRAGSVVIPARGASGRKTQPMTVSKIDHYPGTSKAIPGGLRLYHIDTHFHKDALAARLAIEPGDPGCFWLHSGYTELQQLERQSNPTLPLPGNLDDYARQLCAEYRDERGQWQCPPGKANHLWDCESNGLALALYLQFPARTPKDREKKGMTPSPPTTTQTNNSRPSWFNSRRR